MWTALDLCLVLAASDADVGHVAAAMTKLLVGVAVLIAFLIGLVMMVSVGILGGSAVMTAADHGYYLQVRQRLGGKRAALSVARKLAREASHTRRALGDQALVPAELSTAA